MTQGTEVLGEKAVFERTLGIVDGSLPAAVVERYAEVNTDLVEAPVGIDTAFGATLIQLVIDDVTTWQELHEAQLEGEQLTQIAEAITRRHAAFHVAVIVRDTIPDNPERLHAITQNYIHVHNRPTETDVYTVDGQGYLSMTSQRLTKAFASLKNGCISTAARFAQGAMGLQVTAEQNSLSADDIQTLTEFSTNPAYFPYADAFRRIYKAGSDILLGDDPRAEKLRRLQKSEYNLRHAGHPEFRTTLHMVHMAKLVEEAVEKEADVLCAEGILFPDSVIERFLDDTTHRKTFTV